MIIPYGVRVQPGTDRFLSWLDYPWHRANEGRRWHTDRTHVSRLGSPDLPRLAAEYRHSRRMGIAQR
jgi:hypothetical protein